MNGELRLKAYEVSDDWGDNGAAMVFAVRNVNARREGANEINCEFPDVRCRRAPWADSYAPGPVPLQVCIEVGGWWSECGGCFERVDAETEGAVYIEGDGAWCSAGCRDRELAKRAKDKAEHDAACEAVTAALLARFPFVTPTYAGKHGPDDWFALFTFPGSQYASRWRQNEPGIVYVPPVDHDAWAKVCPAASGGVSP